MPTTNLVSTPNITGNIGSCTTQTTMVTTRQSLWTYDVREIATNSCTGETETYDHFAGLTGDVGFCLFLGMLVVVVSLKIWSNRY